MVSHPVFLSTDIVNSSTICRLLGDSTYKAKLFDPHWAILTSCLQKFNGILISHKGDGLIASFDSIKNAVACSTEMQIQLNSPVIEYQDKRIEIRIGIHRAEVPVAMDDSGKIVSGELNYVCRIESIANGNQILVSDSSLTQFTDHTSYQWLEWQNRRIKSFDDSPVTVWELLWDGNSRGMPGASWAPDWFTGDVSEYISRPEIENRIFQAFGTKSAKPSRLVTLHGSGGTGKTRLALTSAVKMAGLFDGKVHFITFHQKPGEVFDGGALLLQELRNTLGCDDAQLETVLVALALRGDSLFLIDNYETIAGESAQDVIVKILQRTKSVKLLITGQRKVELPDSEYVVELQNGMTVEEGTALFLQRAKNVYHDWHPTSEDFKAIKQIVTLVEGVPLRIEFAAAWIRKRDLQTIVKDLETSPLGKFSSLPSGSRFAATSREHHLSSELCMEYTCSLLKKTEREQFYRLGLFGGSFTAEQVKSACGIENADDLIDALLDASLINRYGDPSQYRYTMHRLTMSYCADKLREQEGWEEVAVRYVRTFKEFALTLGDDGEDGITINTEPFRQEFLNLKRALLVGIEINAIDDTLVLTDRLMEYIKHEDLVNEGVELCDNACRWYRALEFTDPVKLGHLTYLLGSAYEINGNYEKAIEYADKTITLLEANLGRNAKELLDPLRVLAHGLNLQNRFSESEKYNLRAIELSESIYGGPHHRTALHLVALGRLYTLMGRYDEAEKLLNRAKSMFDLLPDKEVKGYYYVLGDLSNLYSSVGKYTQAEPFIIEAIELARQVKGEDSNDVCALLNNLGLLYCNMGRDEEAIVCGEKALAISERRYGKNHPRNANTLSNLAISYDKLGRDTDTLTALTRALDIDLKVYGKIHNSVSTIYTIMGMYYEGKQNWQEATRLYERSLAIIKQLFGAEHPSVAVILSNMGRAQLLQKNYKEAEKLLRQAWILHEQTVGRMHPYTAIMVGMLGQTCFYLEKYDEAEKYLLSALDINEAVLGKDAPSVAACCQSIAKLLATVNRKDEAKKYLHQAIRIFEPNLGVDHPTVIDLRNKLEEAK